MRSREFLRRLDRLRLPAEKAPKKVRDFGVLSRIESTRLRELFDMLRDEDEEMTEAELEELRGLLHKCPLVDSTEVRNRRAETYEEKRQQYPLERAFSRAFHDYAMRYPCIAVPNFSNLLSAYRLDIGYRLFEKYGWVVGERDCATIRPLDQWTPEDRDALIDLYQRANLECSRDTPPGWKSKYR